MIWVRDHSQKRELRNVAPQTILSKFPDIIAPQGSFIIYMNGSKNLWRTALFTRAKELGRDFPVTWPYSYPLYFIMRAESHLQGAEVF